MKEYKIIFSDIDGTLLNNENQVPEETIEELRRLDSEMERNACDAGKLNELYQQRRHTEEKLQQEMARWEELSLQIEE